MSINSNENVYFFKASFLMHDTGASWTYQIYAGTLTHVVFSDI